MAVCVQEVMRFADVAALWDTSAYNAGFIIIKPTNLSKRLYLLVRNITSKSAKIDDQAALNNAIRVLQNTKTGLNATVLNKRRFLSGLEYFEKQRHWHVPAAGETCDRQSTCAVVVHNNWIVGKAAKVYRFREYLMWMYEGDDEYYTSNSRLYLTYTNQAPTVPQDGLSKDQRTEVANSQISALKTAMTIGHLLNRTVILPRFHAGPKAAESPLNSVLHVKSFDSGFAGQYRESSFLSHPKVLPDVKSGLSERQVITDRSGNSTTAGGWITVPEADIMRQFGDAKDKVLVYGSLYGTEVALRNTSHNTVFMKKLRTAIYRSDYRQFERW